MSLNNFAARFAIQFFAVFCGLSLSAQNYKVVAYSIPDPPTQFTQGAGNNDFGAVAGSYEVPHRSGPDYRGFVRQADGTFQYPIVDPNDAGGHATLPLAINDSGLVAGYYRSSADGRFHGFLLAGGNFTTVDEGADDDTFLQALNNNGDFGGAFGPSGSGRNGFISIAGNVTQINVHGALATLITGLASDGSSAGVAQMSSQTLGFVHSRPN